MENREKLAIAQAFYSGLADMVSTKDPENLRGIVDDEYRALYQVSGAKSFDVTINNQKVGTYTVKADKTELKHREEYNTTDIKAFNEWMADNPVTLAAFVLDMREEFTAWLIHETGECPEGMAYVQYDEEVTTKGHGGTLKIDKQKVVDALGAGLPSAINSVLMLGGGE